MSCPTASQIWCFVEQALSPSDIVAVEEHLDGCATCRALLVSIAKGLASNALPRDEAAGANDGGQVGADSNELLPVLKVGSAIGDRYVVVDLIGIGGMGRVYSAYDKVLDRKVAIKFSRRERHDDAERMLREAKTLARLNHPNVVIVYDVGSIQDQTYIAMEYVEGNTLRTWVSKDRPSIQSIVEVFLYAAEGLAAAHAAGLVHRDFKPENVLIGKDARVRVNDFGLARPFLLEADNGGELVQAGETEQTSPKLPHISTHLEGTPLYTAPERFDGRSADARSDQFAFCVSMYEALYGEHPFSFKSLTELPAVLKKGQVRQAPRGGRVPTRLRSILLRGLSPDPASRFGSMKMLMAALRSYRRRLQLLRIAVPLASILIVVVVIGYTRRSAADIPVCQGAERNFEGIWDEPRKNAIQSAFMATNLPYAESSWKLVQETFDRQTARWIAIHRELCLATHVHREQSENVFDRQSACLQGQLIPLRALSQALAGVNKEGIAATYKALERLQDPSMCKSVEVYRDDIVPYRSESMQVMGEAIRVRLAKANALFELGRGEEIGDELQQCEHEASELSYSPVQAEVGMLRARVLRDKKPPSEIQKLLEDALVAAEAGRHERVTLQLWLELASMSIWRSARYDDAGQQLKHAEAYLQRLDGPQQRLELLRLRAALYRGESRIPEAVAAAEQAVRHAEISFGANSLQSASALKELGINLHLSQSAEASRVAMRKSIEIMEKILGTRHPSLSTMLANYGHILLEQDPEHPQEAIEVFRRAVATTQGMTGLRPAIALSALAYALIAAKEYEEGLRLLEQAMAAYDPLVPPHYPDRALDQSYRGVALMGLRRHDEACRAFVQAMKLATASPSANTFVPRIKQDAWTSLQTCSEKICKDTLKTLNAQFEATKTTAPADKQP